MSETPQQPTKPGDEHISSPLPLDIESPPPAGETLAAEPNVASDGHEQSTAPANSAGAAEETGGHAEPVPPLQSPPEESAPKSSDVQSLTAQLAEISNQRDAFQSQYLRIAADFDNFRKRNSKEKEETELRTKQTTISELLSVVDNFERARTQIKPQNEGEMAIHKSYQGVYKQLVESLKRIGVSPMRPEGQQFDPNLHEAVMRQPTEEHPEGTVIEELQRGYYLGDRILRHSLVKVAAPPEQLSAEDAATLDSSDN
ncbi:nucleotide exchange factor GrpE [Chamaesiphon sp. VAR_69_metabat_338]|uniref:nucleotide exchange factor GrpE n=1 Tax=Chamaesiphon sp. VAR_69_metabat_338 TaxID=2964704 RepID=UPI00286E398E|nr:nucleotide exchange factor GrpE [Chamaesiphon sp. VAR_69_metabat_338]